MMKNKINFSSLWDLINKMAMDGNDKRLQSVMLNYSNRKEYICRKLGVVSNNDVQRLKKSLKEKKLFKSI